MFNVVFTDYAIQQLKERRISKMFVIGSIKNVTVIKQQSDGRYQYVKLFEEKQRPFLLVVIAEKFINELIVVTVFKTSKLKKFL